MALPAILGLASGGSLTTAAGALSTAGVTLVGAAFGGVINSVTDLYGNAGILANRPQDIIFPPDLLRNPSAQVPFMSMQFERYERRSINQQPFYTEEMKIRLPIPENLSESISLSYDNPKLGSVMGSVIESFSQGQNVTVGERFSTAGTGAAVGVAANAPGIPGAAAGILGAGRNTTAAVSAGSQAIVNGARDAAGTLLGITANPYQVTLFTSPNFRTHKFSWKFIATSLEESNTLRNLVSILKYHSLPGISSAGAVFFSYPEILKINFRPSDRFLYKFKPCVVTGLTVNYAPNSPSFVKTSGAPTAIMISIDLQEIEILTKADFLRDERGYYSPSTGQLIQDVQRSVERNI